jgi:xanthine/uracil permease
MLGSSRQASADHQPKGSFMTTPPSRWRDSATNLAFTVLAIALMLYVAARLIVAVLPVLIVIGIVALLGFAGWSFYRFRKSRW